MKANEEKCHLLLSKNSSVSIKIKDAKVKNSACEKLLRIQIDNKLNVEAHLNGLCKKASSKIHALARISPYLNQFKKKILMLFFHSAIWILSTRLDVLYPNNNQQN